MKKKSARLPVHVKPERYKIMLRPDFLDFTFSGEETIYLNLDKNTTEITLHAHELEIESAEFTQNKKDSFAGKISYNEKDETATFKFIKTLKKGKGELKLKFKGILNDKLRGFYRSRYTHAGKEKYLATTQFEATDARKAFPSFDEPSLKAIFDVTLMIPERMIAISNTLETKVWEHEAGIKAVEFAPTPKMSTYLLAFIVGDLEYIEGKTKRGVLVRVFTTPGKKEQGRFALSTAIKMLEFYEDYFKIRYPLPVSDLIAIPDFAAGAMENWGAVTYRETALLIDEAHSAAVNRQRVAIVIAHELAHMWFGDLVTMEWWTHLWLNEGFASFIEYLAVDSVFPEWDIWTQFIHMDQGTALKLDSLNTTHPIEVEVFHPSEISEIFDKVSYSKGASIIRMLSEYLGHKDFREGLRHYLKTHQFSNAKTEDLWASFEKVSGKPIKKIMQNWTGKSGYPLLVIEQGKNNLTVTQTRYFSSPISKKETKDKTIWSIPLQVSRENSQQVEQYLIEDKSINIPKSKKGEWIKLNSNEASFVRVDYSAKALDEFKEPIKKKTLEVIDRLGIVRDAFDLSESGNLPTHYALELSLDYQDENDFTIWSTISSRMGQVANLIADEKFYPTFENYGRRVFENIAKKLGWEKKKGELHTDTLLRSLSLYAMGSYKDQETIERALEFWDSGKSIEPDLRGTVYALNAENGDETTFEKLLQMYKDSDNQQEKDRLSRALSSFEQTDLLEKTLDFAISDEVRAQDAVFVIAGVGANPKGRELTWEFIKNNWKLFKERYGGGHFLLARLLQSVDGFVKNSDAADIEQFFKKNPAPEAARTISQVLEQIRSNALWLERDRKGLEQFLKDFGRIKS